MPHCHTLLLLEFVSSKFKKNIYDISEAGSASIFRQCERFVVSYIAEGIRTVHYLIAFGA